MDVLIIEDEKLAANRLEDLLHEYSAEINIVAKIGSVKKAVSWIGINKAPDLIFMDIQLGDGLSFEIFEQLEILVPVVFATAYNEYAIRAFKVNSIDYLLKPIQFKDLKAAMDKFKLLNTNYSFVNKELIEDAKHMINHQYKERFIVKAANHIQSIPTEGVACFFSKERATFLQTIDNKKYIIDYSLEQVESMVCPKQFFRINRKYIISLSAIDNILNYSNSRLKVCVKKIEDNDILVSREKVSDFKKWLDM